MIISFSKLKNSSLFKDSFWAVFGNGFGNFLLLIAGIFIARILGKDLYGEYGLVKSTMFYVAAFATFGLGYTSTKFISSATETGTQNIHNIISASLGITFISSCTLALIIIVFAGPLASYLDEPSLKLAFRYLGAIIVLRALITAENGILAGFKKFKVIAINAVISGAVMFVLAVGLTLLWGLSGSLLALTTAQFCNFILNSIHVYKEWRCCPASEKKYFRILLNFSCPVALQEFSYTMAQWGGSLLLVKYSSLGEMGLYSASAQWNAIISFIPNLLFNVVLSYLSGSLKNKQAHDQTMNRMLMANLVCTLIPFLIVLISSNLIASFYGPSFVELPSVLNYFIFATIFLACSTVYLSEFIAQGRTWTLFSIRFVRDALYLISVFVFLKIYEGNSAAKFYAISTVLTNAFYLFVLYVVYKFYTRKVN